MGRRMNPKRYHGIVALGLSLAGMGLLLIAFRTWNNWALYLAAWFVSVNVVAFCYYGFDKRRAQAAGNRIPEVVLHGLAFVGGSPGAYVGMRTFRHKTIKGSFRIVFWFLVLMQLALIAAVAYRLLQH
jgi:uncharacterized membrane protein YsdA (DUF1294 family)